MKKNFNLRLLNAAFGAALCGMLFTSCTKEDEIQPRLTGEDKLNSAEMAGDAQARQSRLELDAKRGQIMYDSGAQERKGRDLSNDSKSLIDRDNNIQERFLGGESLDHSQINHAGTAIGRLSNASSGAADMRSDEMQMHLLNHKSTVKSLDFTPAQKGTDKAVLHD